MIIELPQVGESVTEGVIGKWLKQVGDRIEKYDPLVEVVTDKVNMEVPSPVSGVLTVILVAEGETILMGAPIAEMEVEGEEEAPRAVPPVKDPVGAKPAPSFHMETGGIVGPTGAREVEAVGRAEAPNAQRPRYSPAVRRLAQEHKLDLAKVKGMGLANRITREDVLRYVEEISKAPAAAAVGPAQVAAADEEVLPLTPVRRMIAENMVKSASQIPAAWSTIEVDVTSLVHRREALKEEFLQREGVELTYLPFVVKALVECLKEHPLLNSTWGGDKVIVKKRINIGIAVASPQGLVVPVVHDADARSIAALAKEIRELTTKARENRLALPDVQGGTFTLNNTGVLGSVISQPIINYPQAAILTTEAIVKRPVVIGDAIAIRSMMNMCITFDHRILDGAEVGAFQAGLKRRLEAIGPDTLIY